MLIALTGATGFVGRHIVRQLRQQNHRLRCLVREESDVAHLGAPDIELVQGDLHDRGSLARLTRGATAVVHAAAWRGDGTGRSFGAIGEDHPFEHLEKNVMGSLALLELAREHARQFVFVSSGAVYGNPPGNVPLDEDYPRSPDNAYGAYKGAVEMFCLGYSRQFDFNASALRPVSVLGLHEPAEASPFFDVVRRVLNGETVETSRGRKAVMVEDVARAAAFAIGREDVKGEVFNLCDEYVREQDVARLAAEAAGVPAKINLIPQPGPQHDMPAGKIKRLGFRFGGREGLTHYVRELVAAAARQPVEAR